MWTWQDVDVHYLETLADQFPALAKYIASVGAIHSKPMMAYLTYMAQRIIEMHRVLKETGSLYLHCDPTASHCLKLLLDGIFVESGGTYRNEIVWCYTGPGSPMMRQFNRKHDTIFWYTKSRHWTFNKDAVRLPYKDPNQSFRKAFDATGEGWTEKDLRKLRAKGKVPETWWRDIPVLLL
jgi:site-specific DNA-methyltransferase (adenine-specific)